MDIETLIATIRSAKLHPIFVDGSAHEESSRNNRLIGSLDEFLEAARVLGASAVFFRISRLEESMFFHESDEQDEFTEDENDRVDAEDELSEVDLRLINKELRKYEEHIGSIATYQLTTGLGPVALDYVLDEPWWVDLDRDLSYAKDLFDSNVEAMRAKAVKEAQSRNLNTLNALRKLIDDDDFVLLPTQKAKIAYAIDRIPELEHLDDYDLRREVQQLDAKIKARGLNKKR